MLARKYEVCPRPPPIHERIALQTARNISKLAAALPKPRTLSGHLPVLVELRAQGDPNTVYRYQVNLPPSSTEKQDGLMDSEEAMMLSRKLNLPSLTQECNVVKAANAEDINMEVKLEPKEDAPQLVLVQDCVHVVANNSVDVTTFQNGGYAMEATKVTHDHFMSVLNELTPSPLDFAVLWAEHNYDKDEQQKEQLEVPLDMLSPPVARPSGNSFKEEQQQPILQAQPQPQSQSHSPEGIVPQPKVANGFKPPPLRKSAKPFKPGHMNNLSEINYKQLAAGPLIRHLELPKTGFKLEDRIVHDHRISSADNGLQAPKLQGTNAFATGHGMQAALSPQQKLPESRYNVSPRKKMPESGFNVPLGYHTPAAIKSSVFATPGSPPNNCGSQLGCNVRNGFSRHAPQEYSQREVKPQQYPNPQQAHIQPVYGPVSQSLSGTAMPSDLPSPEQTTAKKLPPMPLAGFYPPELLSLFRWEYCHLCHMPMRTIRNAREHYFSRSHQHRVDTWLTRYSFVREAKANLSEDVLSQLRTSGPIVFHCDLCDLKLTSVIHARQHFHGRRHRLVERRIKDPQGEGYYDRKTGRWVRTDDKWLLCQVCDVVVTSESQLAMHMAGVRHRKRQHSPSSADPEKPYNGNHVYRINPNGTLSPLNPRGSYLLLAGQSVQGACFNDLDAVYYCEVCHVTLNHMKSVKQHEDGRAHAKKLERLIKPEQPPIHAVLSVSVSSPLSSRSA